MRGCRVIIRVVPITSYSQHQLDPTRGRMSPLWRVPLFLGGCADDWPPVSYHGHLLTENNGRATVTLRDAIVNGHHYVVPHDARFQTSFSYDVVHLGLVPPLMNLCLQSTCMINWALSNSCFSLCLV